MDYTHGILTGFGAIGLGLVIIGLAIMRWRDGAADRRERRRCDEIIKRANLRGES